jgi:acetyltransferase-like isoleucine patch superfamily enzyme
MSYLAQNELEKIGFKKIGKNVKISDKAQIYNPEMIEIGDESRIDDLCVISGVVKIGSYCHVTPMCLIAGGIPGVYISDFCTFAYGVKIFAQSDDYSGETMTNSTIPRKFKNEFFSPVTIEKYSIVGAGSTLFPGIKLSEGTSIGAMSLVNQSTQPWGIYFGIPAKRIKERSKKILDIKLEFLKEIANDSL